MHSNQKGNDEPLNLAVCPACGAPLAQGNRAGMCRACLLEAALGGDSTQFPDPSLTSDAPEARLAHPLTEQPDILFDIGSPSGTTGASFSPDGTRLAAPGADDQIRIWDVATAKVVAKLPDRGWFTRFTADGARLVVISPEGELSVLDGAPFATKEPTR